MAYENVQAAEFCSFPPFYTLQSVLSVRERQLRLWQDLVLRWHHQNNESFLSVSDCPLFHNPAIPRTLKAEDRQIVAQYLIRNGYAEWEDDLRVRLRIMWQKPADVAAKLYQYVKDQGLVNTVLTVYEISSGEQFEGSHFENMDETILRRAIALLEEEGKATLFQGNTSAEDGVKFF